MRCISAAALCVAFAAAAEGTGVRPGIGEHVRPVRDGVTTDGKKQPLLRKDHYQVTHHTKTGKYYWISPVAGGGDWNDYVAVKDVEFVIPADMTITLTSPAWGASKLPAERYWVAQGESAGVRLTGWPGTLLRVHLWRGEDGPLKEYANAYAVCLGELRSGAATPAFGQALRRMEKCRFRMVGLGTLKPQEEATAFIAARRILLSRKAGLDVPPEAFADLPALARLVPARVSRWPEPALCAADDLTRLPADRRQGLPPLAARGEWVAGLAAAAGRLPDWRLWNGADVALARARLIHTRGLLEDRLLEQPAVVSIDMKPMAEALAGLQDLVARDGPRADLPTLFVLAELDVLVSTLLGKDDVRPSVTVVTTPAARGVADVPPLPSRSWDGLARAPDVALLRWNPAWNGQWSGPVEAVASPHVVP